MLIRQACEIALSYSILRLLELIMFYWRDLY